MITIFTIPKPFNGHIKVIQINAIRSWLKLRPSCQIILFGDEEGIAETAKELGVQHVPDIKRNEFGTPLLDYVFKTAHDLAEHDILCYVNADIILMSDFIKAAQIVSQKEREFLIVGRRWNVDMDGLFDFEQHHWEDQLRSCAMEDKRSSRGGIWGIDYFVFSRGLFRDIPPFAVGRACWDNWMIYRGRSTGLPTIDISEFAAIVHQNHDYSHHPAGQEGAYKGVEAQSNLKMAGGIDHKYSLMDVTHLLTSSDLSDSPNFLSRRAMKGYLRQRAWGEGRTVARAAPEINQRGTLFGVPLGQYKALIRITTWYLKHKVNLGPRRYTAEMKLIQKTGMIYGIIYRKLKQSVIG